MWHWPQVVGSRQSQRNWCGAYGMPCSSHGAVLVGTPHGWHCSHPLAIATPLQRNERMRRPFRTAGLILFRKRNLLSAQSFFAVDRGPRHRRVAAAQELLIYSFMAASAIARGQF